MLRSLIFLAATLTHVHSIDNSISCLFGPNEGNFEYTATSLADSESCDRNKCTCTNHDNYVEVALARLEGAQTLTES